MTRTSGGRGGAAIFGTKRAKPVAGLWARQLKAFLSSSGYRPEQHYMRGRNDNDNAARTGKTA